MKNKDLGKAAGGLQANMAACMSYVFGWITGLIFFLVEKENKFVRFHAMQSIVVFGALSIAGVVLSALASFFLVAHAYFMMPLFGFASSALWIVSVILWIVLMIKAYQGERFKLPIAGDIAERNS